MQRRLQSTTCTNECTHVARAVQLRRGMPNGAAQGLCIQHTPTRNNVHPHTANAAEARHPSHPYNSLQQGLCATATTVRQQLHVPTRYSGAQYKKAVNKEALHANVDDVHDQIAGQRPSTS